MTNGGIADPIDSMVIRCLLSLGFRTRLRRPAETCRRGGVRMRRRLARRHRNLHAEQDGHDSDEKEESSIIREADALQCLAWIGLGLIGFAWPGSRNGLTRQERDQAGSDRFRLRSG